MKHQRPLVPEDLPRFADAARERVIDSLVRAVIASGRHAVDRTRSPVEWARKTWPRDEGVATILRGATSPMAIADAGGFAQTTAAFLPALVPVSAGADLLQRALGLRFNGAATINVPSIAVPVCDFVPELAPFPVQKAPTGTGTSLSPHKLGVICTLTSEMMNSSNAEAMVRQVMIESTGPAIDKNLFSVNVGDATRPPGLLHGIAALTPTAAAGSKAETMVDDLAALASAVAPVSGNGQIVLVAAAGQAVSLALRAPREIVWDVLMSGSLAAGTVIAIAVNTVVAVVEGVPQIDSSQHVAIHEETGPAAIVDGAGVLATPVRSVWQTDSAALRLRWPMTWALRDPRGVAWMSAVNW